MPAPSPAEYLVLCFTGTALLHQAACRLALRPWLASAGEHWTARARRFFQFRKTAALCLFSSIVTAFTFSGCAAGGPISGWAVFFCVFGAVIFSAFWIGRIHEPRLTLPVYLRSQLKTTGILIAVIAPVLWVIFSTSENLEPADWIRLGAAIAIFCLFQTGCWLLLMPGRTTHPMNARLAPIVADEAAKAGVPSVRAWVEESFMANAVAVFYIHSVVVTSRGMEVLDDDELRAIVRHELAHLTESAAIRVVRLVGLLPVFAFAFVHPVFHRFGLTGLALLFPAFFLSMRIPRSVARKMEERADKMSVAGGTEGPVYARALEKLYEANRIPAVLRGRQIHPNLYDRMIAAGITPDYPRPLPPARFHWTGVLALLPVVPAYVQIVDWLVHKHR